MSGFRLSEMVDEQGARVGSRGVKGGFTRVFGARFFAERVG